MKKMKRRKRRTRLLDNDCDLAGTLAISSTMPSMPSSAMSSPPSRELGSVHLRRRVELDV
jgi:hypothetical protein